jgi:hypothetical protein
MKPLDACHQILHLEDSPRDVSLVQDLLAAYDLPCEIIAVASKQEYQHALKIKRYDLILCDYNLPSYDGLSALSSARELCPETPVIILSGAINPEEAVECLKNGATDYLLKDRPERLPSAIRRAIKEKVENTKRLEKEIALLESNERTRLIIDNAFDAVVTMDSSGLVTGWNNQAEKMFGWTAGEALGKKMSETIIPQRMRDGHEMGLVRVMATGKSEMFNRRLEMPAIRRDGGEFPVELTLTSFASRGSKYFSAFLRDISEQKKSQKALSESEARFQQMAGSIDEVFWLYDSESNVWAYVSPAYEKIWGKTLETLKRNPQELFDSLDANDREKLKNLLIEGLKRNAYAEFRLTNPRIPSQPLRWIAVHVYPVKNPTGGRKTVAGCAREITDTKEMFKHLNRAQRLESIGQLASGIAHDLNNALAPVMMASHLLRAEYPNASKYLEIIEASTKRSADMVRQLLAFAKGAEGEKIVISCTKLLKEMTVIINNTFPKNINFTPRIAPDLGSVLGDSTQLHQVLLNLCVNARDAMPNGGTLTLEGKSIELDHDFKARHPDAKLGSYVVINVKDTGTGIPPEIIDRIFDPFFSTKETDKGTGLGLSTVMGVVRGHGGFINLESTVGAGTLFSVYIPRTRLDSSHTEHLQKSASDFRGNGELILVVDDEPAIRTMAKSVLEAMNFRVITANEGTSALMAVSAHRADLRLAITDLHMPNLDGLGLVRVLKKTLANVEIIVASGRFDDAAADDLKKLGVKYLIPKPFNQQSLQQILEKVFPPKNN